VTDKPRPYLPEIDGLRAVAVILVVLFHAQVPGFSGGFLGVDVFFVISGYLIGGILFDELRSGTFSASRFYERRARRILPATLATCALTIPPAVYLMLPDELENFGQSLVATMAFSNNILLSRTADYWGLESEFKPLLHTWSLGVEEQFYMVFPWLLYLAWKRKDQAVTILIASILLFSVVAFVYGGVSDKHDAFYLLQCRAWELMAGALLVDRSRPVGGVGYAGEGIADGSRSALATAALVAIVVSVYLAQRDRHNTSLSTILCVVGSAGSIKYCRGMVWIARLLRSKPLIYVGVRSFSIYLLHQPLLAFLRITSLEEPSLPARLCIVLVSVSGAHLLHRFIEIPARLSYTISRRNLYASLSLTGVALIGVGLWFHFVSGNVRSWSGYPVEDIGRGLNAKYNSRINQYSIAESEAIGFEGVLIVGDSFARDFANAGLEGRWLQEGDFAYARLDSGCLGDSSVAQSAVSARLIVFAVSALDEKCWRNDFEMLRQRNQDFIVIGPKQFGWSPSAVARIPESERRLRRVRVSTTTAEWNRQLRALIPEYNYVDLLQVLGIDAAGTVPVTDEAGRLLSQDRSHLTKSGAILLGNALRNHERISRIALIEHGGQFHGPNPSMSQATGKH